MINSIILDRLSAVTPEEQAILEGSHLIDRSLYMEGDRDVIAGDKLLEPGKNIAIRPHTRFIRFPEHTHDYVELVYMCRGSTTHIVGGREILLREGELLMLGQHARQEVLPAGKEDIAVNFIVRPEFFGGIVNYLGSEETPLRRFVLDCLQGDSGGSFLHFQVAGLLPVQNLVENLLWTLISDTPNKRGINQVTMGLLFMQLLNHTDALTLGSREEDTLVTVLRYIEENYRSGSLREAALRTHYELSALSRLIRQKTGRTYTELVQEKRMSQAAWLLQNTGRRVEEISAAVGYENLSYFYRVFEARFGCSPRNYRLATEDSFSANSRH